MDSNEIEIVPIEYSGTFGDLNAEVYYDGDKCEFKEVVYK